MELLRAMLVDFLVGWLEEGAGGLTWSRVFLVWRRVRFGGEVRRGLVWGGLV